MSTPVVAEIKSVLEPVTADTFTERPVLPPLLPTRRRIYD